MTHVNKKNDQQMIYCHQKKFLINKKMMETYKLY